MLIARRVLDVELDVDLACVEEVEGDGEALVEHEWTP